MKTIFWNGNEIQEKSRESIELLTEEDQEIILKTKSLEVEPLKNKVFMEDLE